MNPSQDPASSGETPYETAGPPDRIGPPPGYVAADGTWYPALAPAPRPRPWRRSLLVGVLITLAVTASGIPFGLLWAWAAPSVPVAMTQQGSIVVNDPSPEQFVAADGWFTLLGFAFGALAAVVAWLVVRRHRGPVVLLSVVLGALGAAGVAWQLGRRLGLSGFAHWQDVATAGGTFQRPPDLHAHGPLLVPAFAAVIVCTLLAGWSNDPDLDVPGARPGPAQEATAYYDVSSGSPAGPDPTTAPAPPGSGPTVPPHG